jgi:cation diffusion facilitator CzcD-associated flavoprotein CzcO
MQNENECKYYPVVVIGAGASGIAMGHNLKHNLGLEQFAIFERQSGIGGILLNHTIHSTYFLLIFRLGTWWSNQYPGVVSLVSPREEAASSD